MGVHGVRTADVSLIADYVTAYLTLPRVRLTGFFFDACGGVVLTGLASILLTASAAAASSLSRSVSRLS